MLRHLEYEDWYKYEFIKDKFHQITDCIDVLVDGLYDDSLNNNVGQKGSSNQRCIVPNSKFEEKYKEFDTKIRKSQNFVANEKIISVGIPTKCIYK